MKSKSPLQLVVIILMTVALSACNEKNSSDAGAAPGPIQIEKKMDTVSKMEVIETPSKSIENSISLQRIVELAEDQSNIQEFIENLNKRMIIATVNDNSYDELKLNCNASNSQNAIEADFEENHSTGMKEARILVNTQSNRYGNVTYSCSVLGSEVIQLKKKLVLKRDIHIRTSEKKENYTLTDLDLIGSEMISIGALVIDGATLITEGAQVKLEVEEFVGLNNANLATFDLDKINSPAGHPGRSGGRISLSAQKTFGILEIHLRGTNAGEYGSVENSYENFSIPTAECSFGTYSRTYRFPRAGKAGHRGGNSGILNFSAGKHLMEATVFKSAGKGGDGQISTNPTESLTINFGHVPRAVGYYPWATPSIGRDVDGIWTRHNPDFKVHGRICNSRFIYHFKNRWETYEYVASDIVAKKALPPLSLDQAKSLQSGTQGENGNEEAATIYDGSKKQTLNF